jgi:hypothetical protein
MHTPTELARSATPEGASEQAPASAAARRPDPTDTSPGLLGEQSMHGGVQLGGEPHAGDRVEPSRQAPHARCVGPRPRPGRPLLTLQTVLAAIAADALHLVSEAGGSPPPSPPLRHPTRRTRPARTTPVAARHRAASRPWSPHRRTWRPPEHHPTRRPDRASQPTGQRAPGRRSRPGSTHGWTRRSPARGTTPAATTATPTPPSTRPAQKHAQRRSAPRARPPPSSPGAHHDQGCDGDDVSTLHRVRISLDAVGPDVRRRVVGDPVPGP